MDGRRISLSRYHDKVLGGWVGKSLGGSVGHFEGTKRITRFLVRDLLTEGVVANDDLDIQLVWLDVLLETGVKIDGSDLMAAWLERYDYNMGEYGFARRNYRRGIRPPLSGSFANRFYGTGMGCAIRSEVWGMIAPGNPAAAAALAGVDGSMDHVGDAVDAERLLSAMDAEAFFEDDLRRLIDAGMDFVQPGSELAACMDIARDGFDAGLPWEQVWQRLRDDHGHPDCTYVPINLGIIVMALLYGGGDMERTLGIAVNSGWDVDCTCSTTAALIGITRGWRGLPKEWTDYIGDSVLTLAQTRRAFTSLKAVADATCSAGIAVAGGRPSGTTAIDCDDAGMTARFPRVPGARQSGGVELSIEYPEGPEARAGGSVPVVLVAHNGAGMPVEGRLSVDVPRGWSMGPLTRLVRAGAGETVRERLTFHAPAAGVLFDTNLFSCRLSEDAGGDMSRKTRGAESALVSFGIAGAPVGLAIGPFFDSYDEWLDRSQLPPGRVLRTVTDTISLPEAGEEWGNHRVDIGKEYAEEDFRVADAVRGQFAGGRRVHFSEDCLRFADCFGLKGPGCAYVLLEIMSDRPARPMQLFLGSTDPFVLWWNGKRLFIQPGNRYWFPNNDVVDVQAEKGVNQLVMKMLRTGEDNRFSVVCREPPTHPGYDSSPFVTDLGWNIPGAGQDARGGMDVSEHRPGLRRA